MIREKRRKQRLIKRLLIGILVFMILTVIAVFVVVNVFVVNNVEVEGNELYDEQLITDTVLNDEYSWNSLYVLLKYTFLDIKDVPFIDTMEVKMLDPQTLKIKVYEKGMLGYLYISAIGENAYFDKDGFVVETSTRIIENVPKIEGITCDEVVLYEKLPIDNQKLRELLTLTQALKREGLEPDIIHFGLEQSPVLSYGNAEVWLGSIELLTQKVARLEKILPTIDGVAGILHMEDWTEESSNTIFEKELEMPEDETNTEDEDQEGTQDGADGNPDEEDLPQDDENDDENPEDDVSN
ncbi:MAG: cell division protein FtsQ [Agathobacter sp.]|nr:cell division protein FtsQ [Agathobacter sp.]